MQLGALRRVVSQPHDVFRRFLCRSRMLRAPCAYNDAGLSVYESTVDLTAPGEERRDDKVRDNRVLRISCWIPLHLAIEEKKDPFG